VLAALDAEEYELPLAIEKKTPIGSKLMFSRYRSSDGKAYMSVDLVYQTVDQLRNMTLLDLNHHPAVYPVSLKGISRNDDGLYPAKDVMAKLKAAYREYDSLQKKYKTK
jgi:glucose-1-phosphatase